MIKAATFLFLLALSLFSPVQDQRRLNDLGVAEDSVFTIPERSALAEKLGHRLDSVQRYVAAHIGEMELMAIPAGSETPVKVVGAKWPDNLKISINVLRDKDGRVIYYAEYPVSESGDWLIAYQYFVKSATGKVYGFRRMANFFNSGCVDDVVYETSTYLFDEKFNLLAKSYSLTDEEGEDMTGEGCDFPYDFEYQIARNVNKLAK